MSEHDSNVITGTDDARWFWEEEWQNGEKEASAQIAAGQTTFYASTEEFLAALDRMSAEATVEATTADRYLDHVSAPDGVLPGSYLTHYRTPQPGEERWTMHLAAGTDQRDALTVAPQIGSLLGQDASIAIIPDPAGDPSRCELIRLQNQSN